MADIILSYARPGFGSHLRALWAIAAKDWRHYWRYPLNATSAVLQPIVWLTPVYFMGLAFSVDGEAIAFSGYSGTTDYMSFILIGYALGNFINAVFWGMGYSLKNDMDSGVLESNWLAPTPRLLLLAGRTITSLAITFITSLLMILLAGLIFGFQVTGGVWQALLTALPMLIGLYGLGFAFAAVVMVMRDAQTLVDLSSFLVQIFSGTDFPVTALPRAMLPIALALPLTYGLDAVRGWMLGSRTLLPIRYEILILVVSMFVLIWIGVQVFRWLERHVRTRGTLGGY